MLAPAATEEGRGWCRLCNQPSTPVRSVTCAADSDGRGSRGAEKLQLRWIRRGGGAAPRGRRRALLVGAGSSRTGSPQWVSVRNRGDTWQPSCEPAPPPSARPPPSKPLLSIAGTTCFCNHALFRPPPRLSTRCLGPRLQPLLLLHTLLADHHPLLLSLQRNNPDNELLLRRRKWSSLTICSDILSVVSVYLRVQQSEDNPHSKSSHLPWPGIASLNKNGPLGTGRM